MASSVLDADKTAKIECITRCARVDPAVRMMERLDDAIGYAAQIDFALAARVQALLEEARKYVGEAA